jgi:hypothetical protein
MDIINPCLERIVIHLRRTDADQQDDLGIARIVLVPAIVQRFPSLGRRHRKYQPNVEAGLDQAPRDGMGRWQLPIASKAQITGVPLALSVSITWSCSARVFGTDKRRRRLWWAPR